MYCGLSTASEVFLTFTTQLYQYYSCFCLFALVSDEPEVFLPKYSQTAILHAAHFWRVVNTHTSLEVLAGYYYMSALGDIGSVGMCYGRVVPIMLFFILDLLNSFGIS